MWQSLFARKRDAGWLLDLRRVRAPALSKGLSSSQTLCRSGMLPAPLELDWRRLHRSRAELDRRWSTVPHVGQNTEEKENAKVWEPRVRRMLGHTDRCACFAMFILL